MKMYHVIATKKHPMMFTRTTLANLNKGISLGLLLFCLSGTSAAYAETPAVTTSTPANSVSTTASATPSTTAESASTATTTTSPALSSTPANASVAAAATAPGAVDSKSEPAPVAMGSAPAEAAPAPVATANTAAVANPLTGFSPLSMYQHADGVVKAVMLLLVGASLMSWSVWLVKMWEVFTSRRQLVKSIRELQKQRTLKECPTLSAQCCVIMEQIAQEELTKVAGKTVHHHTAETVKERVHALCLRVEAAEARRLTRGASLLATTSAVAPFVGLFGTVWGIMHSFISIAQQQSTSLSVVAPGIAEALFATALGLVVAIPAVILYNIIGRQITGNRLLIADAMTATLCLVSQDLESMEDGYQFISTAA
ncbi:tonB-system energizer ExbB [Klebsiella indica]|uniref:Biopolymer transport protein ExbB n=1 Tax=Klebsiella indica TaxID=2582917 RepID=A0A5R9L8G9_9ENTR|nr:tonB-system energizer ExbB [Klebsiella indica]TLV04999.1 tonB-system energizer ExbB [Klebsiella indica]